MLPTLLRLSSFSIAVTFMAGVAAAASPTLDRIKATGTVTFAYRDGAAPFSFKARNGRPQGYSVELCERVAAAIGRPRKLSGSRVRSAPGRLGHRADRGLEDPQVPGGA